MFQTTLLGEYANAARMGLREDELMRIVEMGFNHSFSPIAAGIPREPIRGNDILSS
jgi:hypothetical protein